MFPQELQQVSDELPHNTFHWAKTACLVPNLAITQKDAKAATVPSFKKSYDLPTTINSWPHKILH